MTTIAYERYETADISKSQELAKPVPTEHQSAEALVALESAEALVALELSIQTALETYSNVHRGSGHNSLVSTHLYEQAREIVLEYLGLDKTQYTTIFCTPRRATQLKAQLKPRSYHILSSQEIGLPLGVRALAVKSRALPGGAPFQPGGGTARLVFPKRVIWARGADKFEAGTPAIVNVIAFARALRLIQQFGKGAFQHVETEKLSAVEILHHDALEQYTGRRLLHKLRQTLIGQRVSVPTLEGKKPYINLDNAASTPTFTPIWQAVCQAWRQPRQTQQEIVQEAKSICAEFLGAPLAAYDVIFTTNTTEAINLVAESMHRESEHGPKPLVINTTLEHNSNELPWRELPAVTLIRLPVDAEGFVNLDELENHLCADRHKRHIKLVAISGASNVLGVCNDLEEIGRIAHRHGGRLLVDAAQLVAHREIDMEACGIDYLAFSAHKAYAPFGTGVLVARKGLLAFDPTEQKQIDTSGEENIAGIAALGKALMLLQRIGLDLIHQEEQALTEQALRGLAQISGVKVYGIKNLTSPRFAHKGAVIVFRLDGLRANGVAKLLAEQSGIGTRYGCHCAHLLLKNMLHIPPLQEQLQGVIVSLFPQVSLPGLTRISFGIQNTPEEIDKLICALSRIAQQPQTGADNPFTSKKTAIQKQMDDFARIIAQRVYTHRTETG